MEILLFILLYIYFFIFIILYYRWSLKWEKEYLEKTIEENKVLRGESMAVTKIEHEPFPMELIGDPSTALIKPKSDASGNYKLYRKHKTELFEIVYDLYRNAPPLSIFGFATQEEEDEYNKKMNEYLESRKPEIMNRLKEMGFEPHDR